MLAQHCVIETPVPHAWVWAALTDPAGIGRWSGFEHCAADQEVRLEPGGELMCTLHLGDQPIGATLTVLEARENEELYLRTEALIATIYESLVLTSEDADCTLVEYRLEVMSPIAGPALQAWIVQHAAMVQRRLEEYLSATDTWTVQPT